MWADFVELGQREPCYVRYEEGFCTFQLPNISTPPTDHDRDNLAPRHLPLGEVVRDLRGSTDPTQDTCAITIICVHHADYIRVPPTPQIMQDRE